MITFVETEQDNLLHVVVSGKVTTEEIDEIADAANELFHENDKINAIVELQEFKGYTLAAFFEDFQVGISTMNCYNKIAVVGDNKIEEFVINLTQPFISYEIRYFNHKDRDKAIDWVEDKAKV